MGRTDYFTKAQKLCWVDTLTFFIIIGPAILMYLASTGLEPQFKSNTVHLQNKTVTAVVPWILYQADRNMTPIEYHIMQRVRQGCGRLYARSFVNQWKDADAGHALVLIIIAIILPLVSGLVFLLTVPGISLFAKLVPLIHLVSQLMSVSLATFGNFALTTYPLCFLNYVWEGVPLGVILPMATVILCLTYKLYEIRVIISFCKQHVEDWIEGTLDEKLKKEKEKEVEDMLKTLEQFNTLRPSEDQDMDQDQDQDQGPTRDVEPEISEENPKVLLGPDEAAEMRDDDTDFASPSPSTISFLSSK